MFYLTSGAIANALLLISAAIRVPKLRVLSICY